MYMEIDTHDDIEMNIFQDISLALLLHFERKRTLIKKFQMSGKNDMDFSMSYPITTFKGKIYDKQYMI